MRNAKFIKAGINEVREREREREREEREGGKETRGNILNHFLKI